MSVFFLDFNNDIFGCQFRGFATVYPASFCSKGESKNSVSLGKRGDENGAVSLPRSEFHSGHPRARGSGSTEYFSGVRASWRMLLRIWVSRGMRSARSWHFLSARGSTRSPGGEVRDAKAGGPLRAPMEALLKDLTGLPVTERCEHGLRPHGIPHYADEPAHTRL